MTAATGAPQVRPSTEDRSMNTLGNKLRVTVFGQSHAPAHRAAPRQGVPAADSQKVRPLLHIRAHGAEHPGYGGEAVALLYAQAGGPGEAGAPLPAGGGGRG